MQILMKLDNLIEGQVIKWPSKYIKTPYVADVKHPHSGLDCQDDFVEVLAHTASLGCCGLADTGAKILMSPLPKNINPNKKYKNKKYKHLFFIFNQ